MATWPPERTLSSLCAKAEHCTRLRGFSGRGALSSVLSLSLSSLSLSVDLTAISVNGRLRLSPWDKTAACGQRPLQRLRQRCCCRTAAAVVVPLLPPPPPPLLLLLLLCRTPPPSPPPPPRLQLRFYLVRAAGEVVTRWLSRRWSDPLGDAGRCWSPHQGHEISGGLRVMRAAL